MISYRIKMVFNLTVSYCSKPIRCHGVLGNQAATKETDLMQLTLCFLQITYLLECFTSMPIADMP